MEHLDSLLAPLGELLGVPPAAAGVAVLVVLVTTACIVLQQSGGGKTVHIAMDVELHPKHLEYMKRKEAKFCNDDFGKGLRCIFDYLREQEEDHARTIFNEPPKFTDPSEYETNNIHVHPGQFDYFAEHGFKVSEVSGEEFKELSRISRALLDWAMRKEAEGDSQDAILYVQIRCLNCLCT